MTEKNYSLDELNKFLEHAADKGLVNKNTAVSRKAATNKILTVLDESELSDLRTVDIDATFDRFQTKYSMKYSSGSLQVYLSRARKAISDFISYVDNPSAFKPSTVQRTSTKTNNKKKIVSSNVADEKTYTEQDSFNQPQQNTNNIAVPVPLRENVVVNISNLPADLTEVEANRLAAIIKAYAVPTVD